MEINSDLETIKVMLEEENLELILLCSLSSSYMTFEGILLYDCDTLNLDVGYEAIF